MSYSRTGDEFVIVNLFSGNYYSIDAIGAEIWAMVQKGASTAEIITHLSRESDGDIAIIEEAVMSFMREIISENLIVTDAVESSQSPALDNAGSRVHKQFTAPVLHKYTDMQELLLVDPIHEVDETGWPNIAGPISGPSSESHE
jgi:hypothetical protein